MKRKLFLIGFPVLVLLCELSTFFIPLRALTDFWLHVYGVIAVIASGLILLFWPTTRSVSLALLGSGVLAAIVGISAYFLFPFFEPTYPPRLTDGVTAVGRTLAHVLGPFFFAGLGSAAGLILGWFLSCFYLRSHRFA